MRNKFDADMGRFARFPQARVLACLLRGQKVINAFVLLVIILSAFACNTVAFYDKGALSDPTMILQVDGTETHLRQKVTYSREGAVGGIGTTAGGGCGCY